MTVKVTKVRFTLFVEKLHTRVDIPRRQERQMGFGPHTAPECDRVLAQSTGNTSVSLCAVRTDPS